LVLLASVQPAVRLYAIGPIPGFQADSKQVGVVA
jgi:hypothetical protein